MQFSVKDFFSKCDQICSFLWIWSHLLKKSLMENFIFCAVIHTFAPRIMASPSLALSGNLYINQKEIENP